MTNNEIKKLNWDELLVKYGTLNSEISLHVHEGFCEIIHEGKLKDSNIELDRIYCDGIDYYMYLLTGYELHEDTIYITLETMC